MQRFLRPLAALVIALLLLGGIALAMRGGEETYEVTAYFEKAIGLFPNSDVVILGVPVGKVVSVDPQGSKVKAVMRVSDDYKVPADAFAQIVPPSVIADRFVQLHPPYTGGATLADGAVLDLDRTQIPAELDDVFKQLKKLLEAIEPGAEGEPGALGSLIVELNETLRDRERDLKGTIVNTAALTGALSDAQADLSDTLINLDDFFGTLATQAGSIGSLNRNLATVMSTLAGSRDDLEATLENLADMTGEIGRLVQTHRGRLGKDLELAANVLSAILENRRSVEESLSWLPVVAIGLKNAYHGGEIKATDVRDSLNDISCTPIEDLPDGPIKDALREICRDFTSEPPPDAPVAGPATPAATRADRTLDCREGVRKVRRQLKRLREVNVPAAVLEQVVEPMERKLRRLARECKKFGEQLTGKGSILGTGGLIDSLTEDIGGIPDADEPSGDNVTGVAAGPAAVGGSSVSPFESFTRWLSGLTSFLGWSW